MKKLLTVMTAMVAGSALYAAPVLNPAEPALITDGVFLCDDDCWGLKVGYRGNFVYNRSMHAPRSNESVFLGGDISEFSYYSNSGVLTLNLWDRLDIYGFVGAANAEFEGQIHDGHLTFNDYESVEFSTKTRTNWGVGAKVVLWETCWGCVGTTYIGLDANYESLVNSDLRSGSLSGYNYNDWTANGPGLNWYETQVSLGIAHRICNLVPYIAAKWSNAGFTGTGYYDNDVATVDNVYIPGSHSNRHWGWAFGATLVDANRMTVTAEARFCDETALSIAAEFKF